MRNLFLLLFCCGIGLMSFAQQVTGHIKDPQGKPLAGVSVALKKAKDSSIVKFAITDAVGTYKFPEIGNGKYFIQSTHVGYNTSSAEFFEVQGGRDVEVKDISLAKADGNLKEVVVTGRKPVIEVRADKMILNVEGSVNAVGQDALELLRKSPGITIDKDDNLSLSGKNGVQVYIDGRPSPLTGKDLSEYLKTIQSSNIESIEIISNPSAKYDAAGNAGIINIKLKKNKSYGTNGSINAGYNIGTYSKYNAGISLNQRTAKVNLFSNYSYNHNLNEFYIYLTRSLLDSLFDQHSVIKNNGNSHNVKVGADYFLNKKNTIGVMMNGTYSDNSFITDGVTPISYIPTAKVNRILRANNSSTGRRDNTNFNVNYRFADTSGHELNVDGDYGLYRIRSNQLQPNEYFTPKGDTLLYSNVYNMIAPTNIDIYSGKADYEQNLGKGKLGLGAKVSFVKSGNDFQQYSVFTNSKEYDTLHSNNFDYKENINALYANYNRNLKGWQIQAGLRMENTNITGTSTGYKSSGGGNITYDSTFKRHYTDLFPSAAITYNKNPMKQWSVTYSRRIDRPAYQDLNPFEFKLDEYTFQKGNTQLLPQYTNSVGLTYMYKYKLTTTLNYSHVKDVFTQLVDTTDKSKSFLTKKNLAVQDITSLNISYPLQIKWYSAFINVNTYYSRYKANFGTGRTIDLDVFALNLYAQQTVRLGKGWTGEVSGFYTTPSIWQGTFKTKALGSLDGGIQKTVLQGKGTFKVSVSDIFHTLHWNATSDFAGQHVNARGGFESRQLKLYFTYRFGNNQVKAARQRKTGLEDESKRVGTQGGGLSQ